MNGAANTPGDACGRRADDPGEQEFLLLGQIADEINREWREGRNPDLERLVAGHHLMETHLRGLLPALQVLHVAGDYLSQPPEAESAGELPPQIRRLGDYQLLRQIGRGGMGIVFEAEQISLRRRVAVKMLPMAAAWDEHRLHRFQKEAHAAARLHHQNIVPVYTVGCEQGVHFFAMQCVEGQSLAQIIAQLRQGVPLAAGQTVLPDHGVIGATTIQFHRPISAQRSPSEKSDERSSSAAADSAEALPSSGSSRQLTQFYRFVATLGVQAAEALEHAHQHQVVHRDIKPSNLLVEPSGHLWITDFGLAQFPGDESLTDTGDVLGTARYMSPEQARAQHADIDHRSDIYSLGATLYELLTLHPAVEGTTFEEILQNLARREPRRLRRFSRSIPLDLETIVLKAISDEPAARYATAQLMADDLQRFLNDEPIQAKRPSLARIVMAFTRRHARTIMAAGISAVIVTSLITLASYLAPHAESPATIAHREANLGLRMKAQGQYQDAIVRLTRALDLDPRNDRYLAERASCYQETGQLELADRDLSRALALHRDLPLLHDRARISQKRQAWDMVGVDYGEMLRHSLLTDPTMLDLFDLQQEYIQEQLRACPDATWLWVAQSVAKLKRYDSRGALEDLARASELEPDTHWVLGHLGSTHLVRGEIDEAIASLSRAIRRQQDCAVYWANRASARGFLGQFPEALSDIAQAVQLAPHEAEPLQVRGRLRSKAGQTEAAIADFETSVRLNPAGESQMWSSFANAIRRRGATEHDRRFAEELFQRHADLALVQAHWGNVCLYAGEREEAINSLLAASQKQPHDPLIKRKLYEALLALEDLDRARAIMTDLAQLGKGPANWWYVAELQRMSGNIDAFCEISNKLLRSRLVPLLAGSVALSCAETPDLKTYPTHMIDLVDSALAQHPHVQMYLASGAVRYRLGQADAALPYLQHAVQTTDNWHSSFDQFFGTEAAFFLAMAQQASGRTIEAQASLLRAQTRLQQLQDAADKPYPDMAWKLERLRQESEALLNHASTSSVPREPED